MTEICLTLDWENPFWCITLICFKSSLSGGLQNHKVFSKPAAVHYCWQHTALQNRISTPWYPLSLQRSNHTCSCPTLLDANKLRLRAAIVQCFYFDCLFVNMRKDLCFNFHNVLKTTFSGMQSSVSIT